MNIDDITNFKLPSGPALPHIFRAQREHLDKYTGIETTNGFPVPVAPWNLDDRFVQKRIKDLCWCATEEIAESLEERLNIDHSNLEKWREQWDSNAPLRHLMEELADATHFFVEACIFSGLTAQDVMAAERFWNEDRDTMDVPHHRMAALHGACSEFILMLGLACNCLKNKTWKTTHMQTDQAKFRRCMFEAWKWFTKIWCAIGVTVPEVFALYHRKSEVNKFRQATNY